MIKQNECLKREFDHLALEQLFHCLSDGLVILDSQRNIINMNEVAAQIFPEIRDHMASKVPIEKFSSALNRITEKRDLSIFSWQDRFYMPSFIPLGEDEDIKGYLLLLNDVTSRRNEERLRLIYEQISSVVFEWDIISNRIYYSSRFKQYFGYEINGTDTLVNDAFTFLHKDDISVLKEAMETLKSGKSINCEYRLKRIVDSEMHYEWVNVRSNPLLDEMGKPYFAIGTIASIQKQKMEIELLSEKSQFDLLTGLLNKIQFQSEAEKCLKEKLVDLSYNYCLVVIDIDDFRVINEKIGHYDADSILKEVATRIKYYFLPEDIAGRFGGDEFVALVRFENSERKNIFAQMSGLVDELKKPYLVRGVQSNVSVSIGVAFNNEPGSSVEELFRNADKALYLSKQNGKGCFSIYNKSNNML